MKKGTIVRTAVLIFALVNQILTIAGVNPLPFTNEEFEAGFSMALTVVASLWAWWKNNDFTKNAIEAGKYLDKLKSGEVKTTEV